MRIALRFRVFLAITTVAAIGAGLAAVPKAHARAASPDRSMKLELLEAMHGPPKVIWFGSSSSRLVAPGEIRRASGKGAFNASLSAATTYDVHYYAQRMGEMWPNRHPHVVWGLDVEVFRSRPIRPIRRRAAGATPTALSRYTPRGFVRKDPLAGAVLSRRLRPSVERMRTDIYSSYGGLAPGTRRHFEAALRNMNKNGARPTLVLMPVHPYTERRLGPYGRAARKRDVKVYLRSLRRKGYRFRFVDASSPYLIGGSPSGFYDAGHLKASNSRALVRYLARHGLL